MPPETRRFPLSSPLVGKDIEETTREQYTEHGTETGYKFEKKLDLNSRLTRVIYGHYMDPSYNVPPETSDGTSNLSSIPCAQVRQLSSILTDLDQLDLAELERILVKHTDESDIDRRHANCLHSLQNLANRVGQREANLKTKHGDPVAKRRIDAAVMLGKEANRLAGLSPQFTHLLRSEILLTLAANLRRRYRYTSVAPDIEEALLTVGDALAFCPQDTSYRADGLRLLAKCLRSHWCQSTTMETFPIPHDHYLHRTIKLEELANTILPLEVFDCHDKLLPDIDFLVPKGQNFCDSVSIIRRLVFDDPRNPGAKLELLLSAHLVSVCLLPQSHHTCGVELDEIADELRDTLEEGGTEDYPDPSSVISIEEHAYEVAKTVRFCQGRAVSQLAASLYRRYQAEAPWTCSTDLVRATVYAIQAFYIGHEYIHTLKILENIFRTQHEESLLEHDQDLWERFNCDRDCLESIRLSGCAPSENIIPPNILRDSLPIFVCPIAKALQEDDVANWTKEKWVVIIEMHAADRSHFDQSPFECSRALRRLVNHLEPVLGDISSRVIAEGLICIHPGQPAQRLELLKESSIFLLRQFQSKEGGPGDLDTAIAYCGESVGLYATLKNEFLGGYPPHYTLATLYLTRYLHCTRNMEDLQNTIDYARASLIALGSREMGMPVTQSQMLLCKALRYRSILANCALALDESIKLARLAYSTQSDLFQSSVGGLKLRAIEQLSLSLFERGITTGESHDLLEVVSLAQEALISAPGWILMLKCYSNALKALPTSRLHRGLFDPLVSQMRAVDDDADIKTELATLLFLRFKTYASGSDLDEAIHLFEITQDTQDTGGSNQEFRTVAIYAHLLVERCKINNELRDVDVAYSVVENVSQQVSELAPRGKTALRFHILNASIYHTRFQLCTPKSMDTGTLVIQSCTSALECDGSVRAASERLELLDVALMRASVAGQLGLPDAVLYYEAAIEKLHDIITLKQNIHSRLENIKRIATGTAGDAAACAILDGRYEKSLELLERGRSIFWQQALHLRTDLHDLEQQYPTLAIKLVQIQAALEANAFKDRAGTIGIATNQLLDNESLVQSQREAGEEYDALVGTIRALPGYEDFLRAKPFSYMQADLSKEVTTIVVLTVSRVFDRCDALILRTSGIQHLYLGRLDPAQVAAISRDYAKAIAASQRTSVRSSEESEERRFVAGLGSQSTLEKVLRLLWTHVAQPILARLDFIGVSSLHAVIPVYLLPSPDSFAGLPLHAAGIYTAGSNVCLADYANSSYIPTLASIRSRTPKEPQPRVLVVSQPKTPGLPPLPATKLEIEHICASTKMDVNVLEHTNATVKRFLDNLPSSDIVHVACHGTQDAHDPTKSAIMLYDGSVSMSRIMRTPLPRARLAFLSACETAMGDEGLPDEILHLSAAFIFAGFENVVGTLWSIKDKDGPVVAKLFYERLSTQQAQGGINNIDSSLALHEAIAELKKTGVNLMRWVPFVHMGY